MRWRMLFTADGNVGLFYNGELVAGSDDFHLLLSFFGDLTQVASCSTSS